MTDESSLPLRDRSFTAHTPDESVWVRVSLRGETRVQLEPAAMRRPGHEVAERVMACADVAYLLGQLALRRELERAYLADAAAAVDGMPTPSDLAAAQERLGRL